MLVAVVVERTGSSQATRITSSAGCELNEGTLAAFAEVVRGKAPDGTYSVVELKPSATGRQRPRIGFTCYKWHVGEGFEHKEGWWVDVAS